MSWDSAAFSPRRIAVFGASSEDGKVGRVLFENLLRTSDCEVVPIHPAAWQVLGRPAFASLADVPGGADLAVVVTPSGTVPGVLRDCGASGVRAAIVLSGGFAETGAPGQALEKEALRVAKDRGVRLIGPNCFGLMDVHRGLNASMALGLPQPGGVSLFTQSGAYGMAAVSRSQDQSIGFAKVLSAGNKSDLNEVDALACFGQDPETRVVAMVLESLVDGPGLVQVLREVTPVKPVVILKTGRGRAGQRAAASHTAALAQDFEVTRAVLKQAGAILVEDGMTLFDVAAALDRQPRMIGRRVGIVTNSGGTGVELADLCEAAGLDVPALSPALSAEIATHLPPHGSSANPIDVTTAWQRFEPMYRESVRALLDSDEVDAVVPVLLQRSALHDGVVDAVIGLATDPHARKPVHVCWAGPPEGERLRRKLVTHGVPCHTWAGHSVRVLSHCQRTLPHAPPRIGAAYPLPDGADQDGWLPPATLFRLLESWDLPVAPWRLVNDAREASAAAEDLGPKVVMKAVRPGLVHKTEARAVRLGLTGPEQVTAAFDDFEHRLGPGPALLQQQADAGVELVLGAVRDATFGPVTLCGLGGIWAEALHDVAMRLCPIDSVEAERAVAELRGARVLDGARGARPVDRLSLARLISQLSIAMARAPWCMELDLNPVIATGSSFLIVDARMRTERLKS
jgi:acetyltransferase